MKDWQLAVEISDLRTPSLRVRGPQLVPHAARKQGRILLRIIELKIIKNLLKNFFGGVGYKHGIRVLAKLHKHLIDYMRQS